MIFKQQIQSLKDKLENLLKIGNVTKVNGSDGELQEFQLKTLRNIEDAMKVGQFGFNSKAPTDSRVIVAKIGNENIVIANEHIASIIDIASGDTVIYNESGTTIKLEGSDINIKGSTIAIDGDLTVTGNIDSDGEVTAKSASPSTRVGLSSHLTTSFGTPPTPGT